MNEHPTTDWDDAARPSAARRGALADASRPASRRLLLLAASGLVLIGAVAAVVGFLMFVARVEGPPGALPERAEGMVALTGGSQRIADAVDLLASGRAGRLLITGVNQATTSGEIARLLPRYRDLFSCCIDLGREALNTVGNATETRRWVRRHRMRSLIIVTSNYHMPRALVELASALPDTELFPYPVVSDRERQGPWWYDAQLVRLLALEYAKYLVAVARTRFAGGADDGDPVSTVRRD